MDEKINGSIYIAGPLYTPAQRHYLEGLAEKFESNGIPTFLPHRDAGIAESDEDRSRTIYEQNVEHIEDAAAVVAVLNGFDVDPGTAFEIGYAVSIEKTVVGVLEDLRTSDDVAMGDDSDVNLMITQSVDSIVQDSDALVDAVLSWT